MENLMNNLQRNGDDLTTATSLRLPSRPLHGIFEDHGQSLVSSSQQKRSSGIRRQVSGIQKFKPATTLEKSGPSTSKTSTMTTASTVTAHIELSDSQSDDEMDLLSSRRSMPDSPSTSQKKRVSHTNSDTDRGFLGSDGKWHPFLKGFEPKHHILSALKFNKNKEVDKAKGKFSDTVLLQPTQPSSSLPASRQLASPSKNCNALASSSKSKRETSTSIRDTIYVSRPLNSKDRNSKSESGSRASLVDHPPRENHPFEPQPITRELKFGPPSRSAYPRIKRINNPEFGYQKPTQFSTSKGQNSSLAVALDSVALDAKGRRNIRSRSPSRSSSRSRCSSTKITVRKPEDFPTLSPPSSPILLKQQPTHFPPLSPLADSKSQASGSLRRSKRQANPFPLLSPPSKGGEVEAFRGRTVIKRIKKGKTKEGGDSLLTGSDDEDDTGLPIAVSSSLKDSGNGKERSQPGTTKNGTNKRPKRFPMSAKMLQSIDSSPSTLSPPRREKRLSNGSGDERISKRSKKERDTFLQSPTRTFEEEGESLLFSPQIDPRSLCPYCDTPLPEQPSSLLLGLIAATRKKASLDPRPSNPLGLKAPVAVFVTVCQRHRFESQILPEAEKKGWPKTIEWSKVANRVIKMKNVLRTIIEDPGDNDTRNVRRTGEVEDDWEVPHGNKKTTENRKRKGPKANSIFWNEVIQEIKVKGSRVVAGVRGQFANFEKAQPGYYGEQGSVIIHQTLYDMFPPSSMNADLIAPLTGNEFMEKILVPEVALRLIMEDRDLEGEDGEKEGLTILRESSSYGVFMFPEDGGEWSGQRRKPRDNQLGVGDMIVMQRAMKRRKELEEEREEEERMLQSEQEGEAWRRMNVRRDKEPAPPRPRPRGKAFNAMTMSSSQDEFRTSRQLTKGCQSDCGDTDTIETAVEISESDSDSGWRVTLQQSSSAGETMRQGFQGSSMRSTNRAISGLNLSSDTDASSRAVVGARPFTRSKSRSVVRKTETRSSRMEFDRAYEDAIKTPMPTCHNIGLEGDDTPKASGSLHSRQTPPLLRARRRQNKESAEPLRKNYGLPMPPLPTRIHHSYRVQGGTSQDDKWLLEDEESS